NVAIVGDFNGWDVEASPLKKGKDGVFKITLDLATGGEYEYRFVVDGSYINDPEAEKYYFNHYAGQDNSVVSL
ncbi:MAG: isoamylase early set domain-containing protein, partial [Flavobacteriaceae bacterium]|nr:isoamylase early set domain-containing protein [Flavobacteriaceae bacterium]MDR3273090.1 isoamylase early set domain-containing protein [Flavobacteriaceae bacterium]